MITNDKMLKTAKAGAKKTNKSHIHSYLSTKKEGMTVEGFDSPLQNN